MTDRELQEIVAGLRVAGTDHAGVEAKRAEHELPRRLWETLSAFSNTLGGGVIVLGLDEASGFAAVGVRDPKRVQQDLASLCDQMEPPLRPQIRLHTFESKVLIVAEIPELERALKPCHYRGAGITNGSFIRVADGDRKLTSYEIQLLVASRGQPRDDEEPMTEASASDLDGELVRGLLAEVRRDGAGHLTRLSDDEVLRTLKVLVRAGDRHVPSVAGLLALGKLPQQFFPALAVQFVVYPEATVGEPGPAGERFLDNRRLEGPIASLLDQTLDALRRNMRRKTVVKSARREDLWDYPETALREVIVNAVAHRDLSAAARGTPVQVQMFPDRLVVVNPGGLFGPVTIETLGDSGVSAARNATLMRLLEDAPGPGGSRPVCENRGSGIGAMIHALRRAGLEPPRFDDHIATFQVTFPNHSLLDNETLAWLERLRVPGLTETQRMGLALLRHGHILDNTLFRQATGLDSRVATRELGELVVRGLVVQEGTRRWTTYRLAAIPGRRERRSEILELLDDRGELSRADIARALGLSDAATRQWMKRLRDEGRVELTGPARSPSVKYRPRKLP